jgi:hypothetical protein
MVAVLTPSELGPARPGSAGVAVQKPVDGVNRFFSAGQAVIAETGVCGAPVFFSGGGGSETP